ncbi:MAG: hypothetical protein GKR89_20970 [Candidatus Latescibacteria bacterium]|nr:hypothetical protein [Candidatus Latescibacterota bacterium]
MTSERPAVLLAFDERVRQNYIDEADLARLKGLADWDWFPCSGGGIYSGNEDPAAAQALADRLAQVDALVVCHGCPVVDETVLQQAPRLRLIGELEGDRFASRIDLPAAWNRGLRTVDTTNGSSYPVAEWALGLILVSLRNAGQHFRRIIGGQKQLPHDSDPGYLNGELFGKRVGLIGCGHIGRRLIKFLRPFETDIWVHDPYLPGEMADALDFNLTSLENVLGQCHVVVCLAPQTPSTEGLLGTQELAHLRPGAVLVNVSRGKVIDSDALMARLEQGDIVAGLDVFDPEPFGDHPITQLDNVFLTPHIAGVVAASYPRFFNLMVDELERFFNGHTTLFDLTDRSRANRQGD